MIGQAVDVISDVNPAQLRKGSISLLFSGDCYSLPMRTFGQFADEFGDRLVLTFSEEEKNPARRGIVGEIFVDTFSARELARATRTVCESLARHFPDAIQIPL